MKKSGAVIVGGDFQGLGVIRSLARQKVPTYLLDWDLCIGRFSRYTKRFMKCPSVTQETRFLNFLLDLAKKEKLNGWLIYPNDDDTVCFLAKHKEQLEEYYRIPTPPWNITRFACEKKATYQLAERLNIAVPKTFYPNSIEELDDLALDFPVIIKPSVKEPFYHTTGKKAIRVDSKRELIERFKVVRHTVGNSEIMVQDFIPGGANRLYSVGSLFKDGGFLGKVVARRTRQHPMDFGHATTYAETVDMPELEEIAKKILSAMNYYGLSEVEFMQDPRDAKYKLLEINARPWGWHTLAIAAGVDLPYLLYQDMLGERVQVDDFQKGVKWIRLTTDIPTAINEIIKGNLRITDYLRTFQGRKHFAVLSAKDPLPFIVEVLMIPYLWKKRGF